MRIIHVDSDKKFQILTKSFLSEGYFWLESTILGRTTTWDTFQENTVILLFDGEFTVSNVEVAKVAWPTIEIEKYLMSSLMEIKEINQRVHRKEPISSEDFGLLLEARRERAAEENEFDPNQPLAQSRLMIFSNLLDVYQLVEHKEGAPAPMPKVVFPECMAELLGQYCGGSDRTFDSFLFEFTGAFVLNTRRCFTKEQIQWWYNTKSPMQKLVFAHVFGYEIQDTKKTLPSGGTFRTRELIC